MLRIGNPHSKYRWCDCEWSYIISFSVWGNRAENKCYFSNQGQQNERIYENFEFQLQDDQSQYEALKPPTAASETW